MKGAYWPVFLAVAALSFAATWKFSPQCVESLPDSVREMCRETTHRAMQLLGKEEAPIPSNAAEPDSGSQVVATSGDDLPEGISQTPGRPAKVAFAEPRASDGVRQDEPSVAVQVAAGAVDPLDLPSTRGVMQADPKLATWGVVNQTTDLETLRGRDLGTVPGGRFFIIERRIRHEKGLLLAGNFWPRELAEPVQILASNLYTFSGRPDDL